MWTLMGWRAAPSAVKEAVTSKPRERFAVEDYPFHRYPGLNLL
jgi:hypothetical protein